MSIALRHTNASDLPVIWQIHRDAFGSEEEAELVLALMSDVTARPALSMIAIQDDHPVGHVLFTATQVNDLSTSILCPLAVLPEVQSKGVGSRLINGGVEDLTQSEQDTVFVLGSPEYYGRFGFRPATVQGFDPPYPLPPQYSDAWMALPLSDAQGSGRVVCADALMDPKFWSE